jgi:hypothetical protein
MVVFVLVVVVVVVVVAGISFWGLELWSECSRRGG